MDIESPGSESRPLPGGTVAARTQPSTGRGVAPVVEPGRRCLGDRYELHQLIAAGGMGQVWRAPELALPRPAAGKVLPREDTGDPTLLPRLRAAAQNAAPPRHPHPAAAFDYGAE